MVVLQAEFETQACIVEKNDSTKDQPNDMQNGTQDGTKIPVQNDGQTSDQVDTDCIPQVRRLAWRILHTS
jgi:hypothetical protein